MQSHFPNRASKLAVAATILMLLIAMLLPVCHLHPLLDKGAADRCTICVSLHAATPLPVHLPPAVSLLQTGAVFVVSAPALLARVVHFSPTRAPPLSDC